VKATDDKIHLGCSLGHVELKDLGSDDMIQSSKDLGLDDKIQSSKDSGLDDKTIQSLVKVKGVKLLRLGCSVVHVVRERLA
jgi:hypothetical protein